MKTLVITGAARQKGHTNQMVKLFLDTLGGDYDLSTLIVWRMWRLARIAGTAGTKRDAVSKTECRRFTISWKPRIILCWRLRCIFIPSLVK